MKLLEVTKVQLIRTPNEVGSEITSNDYYYPKKVVMLPISKLTSYEGWRKARKKHTISAESRDKVEQLKVAIKKGKKVPPIFVRWHKGRYQVIDGHHRLEAYRELHFQRIPTQIVDSFNIKGDTD